LAPVVVAALLLAVSCSDDDDSTAPEPEESTTSPRPTTTAPPDQAGESRLRRQIEELLSHYDEVTGEIVANPDISANRDHRLYRELAGLLVPDTEMTEAVVNALVQRGQRGEYQLPVDGKERPVERRLDGSVGTISDDEVSFLVCIILQYRDFDPQGVQRRVLPALAESGRGTATRINGEWRLVRLEAYGPSGCEEAH
jgi:hypothetical protein